jgi:hypothetical protein
VVIVEKFRQLFTQHLVTLTMMAQMHSALE